MNSRPTEQAIDPNRVATVAMDRYQILISSVEIEAGHLEHELSRIRPEWIGATQHAALLRVLEGLRAAVEEACRPTPPLLDERGEEIPAWQQAG
jgi:hypothetical protein